MRPAVQSGTEPVEGFVEQSGHLAEPLDDPRGVVRFGDAQHAGRLEQVDVHAFHLVRAQLDQTCVDGVERVAQQRVEQAERDAVGERERSGVDGRGSIGEGLPASPVDALALGRQRLEPVVEPVVADEGGEGRCNVEQRLPGVLGECGDVGIGHRASLGGRSGDRPAMHGAMSGRLDATQSRPGQRGDLRGEDLG